MSKKTMLRRIAAAWALILIPLGAVQAGETPAQAIWRERILDRPSSRILDGFEVIPMVCFRAVSGIPTRTAAMGSIIRQTGGVEVMQSAQYLPRALAYATFLKGDMLTTAEEEKVRALVTKLVDDYGKHRPAVKIPSTEVHITFGLADVVNLQRTIGKCGTVHDAIAEVERLHGVRTVLEVCEDASFLNIRKSIHKSIPVLLEAKNGTWLVCLGYLAEDNEQLLLLNAPDKTPLAYRPGNIPESDWESDDPRVRRGVAGILKQKILGDYQVACSKGIPDEGFVIEPFERDKYKAYFIHYWEYSAEPLKGDLLKILKIPETTKPAERGEPTRMQDVWGKFFRNCEYTVLGNSKLVAMTFVKSGGYVPKMCAALTSASCGKFGPQIAECGLEPKKFYRAARALIGGWAMELTGEETAALDRLLAAGQQQYEKYQKSTLLYTRECRLPCYRAALRLAATAEQTERLDILLDRIARNHGWTSVVEGGKPLPFDKYQEALDKNIPILLQAGADWLVSCGYVILEGKPQLLIVDPGQLPGSEFQITNDRDFPKQGFRFEPFEQDHYVPYFVYGWERSVGAYAKEIAEIMKGHPKPETPASPTEKKENK